MTFFISQFPSLIAHHSSLITHHSSLKIPHPVWHHHSLTITQYFSHCLWASFLSLGQSKAVLLPTTGFHPHQPPLFSFPLTSPVIKYHTSFSKTKQTRTQMCEEQSSPANFSHIFSPFSSPTSQIQTHHSHITNPNPTSQKSKPHNHISSPNSMPTNQIRNLKSP